ncbi:uncharacterized protein HD556DRAFT_1309667 [Suillus plorans]|uniref:Uncharacterized protein n=1 Tax=Suillus plorans TaxID=116603 RepID=A0A9P7ALA0_9AGAM|nr:uncharacterized protein HD556DRAFT_1309667 [Suillus plorans]KAG1791849.1 hypothetical protein HD556DRAFT_1309667 [Suillus plorans]
MVFYAYVKHLTNNRTSRYVITFASRAVADEWWRAVSTSTTGFANGIQRVDAQFYTHETHLAHAPDSLITAGVATQFLGKVFFTSLNDLNMNLRGLNIIPPLDHLLTTLAGTPLPKFFHSVEMVKELLYTENGEEWELA